MDVFSTFPGSKAEHQYKSNCQTHKPNLQKHFAHTRAFRFHPPNAKHLENDGANFCSRVPGIQQPGESPGEIEKTSTKCRVAVFPPGHHPSTKPPPFCQVTTFPPSHRPSIGETRYPAGKPGFFFNFWTTLQLSREYADVLARLALPKEPSRQSRTHRIVPRWHFPRKNPRATFQDTPLRPAKLQCCPKFQPESGMAPYCAPIKPIRQSQ